MVYHHSGQVKVQTRNWNLTLSVFWMMKIRRTPTPVSEAIGPATQFAPVRLLPIRLNCHHVLLMSRSAGGFAATVCRLGAAAAMAVAVGEPDVDTSMPMTDRSALGRARMTSPAAYAPLGMRVTADTVPE